MRSEHVGMPYRNPLYFRERLSFMRYGDVVECLHWRRSENNGREIDTCDRRKIQPTVIPSDWKIAGLLPAPALPSPQVETVQAEPTPEPEPDQTPDLAASLFGAAVVVAEPEPEPEPEPKQDVMFTYKSGKVKHELRAGATIVKMGRTYYNLNGRKITAIYTDDTCKRTVPENYYSRLFNVSEDPTLFA